MGVVDIERKGLLQAVLFCIIRRLLERSILRSISQVLCQMVY
ncbi:hypothetical protein RUMHYD_02466 [Blautia hydrogenotrophica DSM 10507]|uniref:Uncharacterized protein n=1 Tax=Blautia hydrogenotrophica (strain DSM 10507 / JCM 14656 / S5a33) TaxID=476272 RepID=C0CNM3_BLAHS|nr:hypothetical protein RUMHYD_02466 [Blautia hydrogenotrophica DSM 10507]